MEERNFGHRSRGDGKTKEQACHAFKVILQYSTLKVLNSQHSRFE